MGCRRANVLKERRGRNLVLVLEGINGSGAKTESRLMGGNPISKPLRDGAQKGER